MAQFGIPLATSPCTLIAPEEEVQTISSVKHKQLDFEDLEDVESKESDNIDSDLEELILVWSEESTEATFVFALDDAEVAQLMGPKVQEEETTIRDLKIPVCVRPISSDLAEPVAGHTVPDLSLCLRSVGGQSVDLPSAAHNPLQCRVCSSMRVLGLCASACGAHVLLHCGRWALHVRVRVLLCLFV